jgi:hypothetical protein
MIPAFVYFAIMLALDEVRRIYLRVGTGRTANNKVKYTGWVAQNTLW